MVKALGIKVNELKTHGVFHRLDTTQINLTMKKVVISYVNSVSVLGVQFDSKFSWSSQISNCIKSKISTTCNTVN
jgi:hypothetical protein